MNFNGTAPYVPRLNVSKFSKLRVAMRIPAVNMTTIPR